MRFVPHRTLSSLDPFASVWTPTYLDYYLIGRHLSQSRRSAPVHCCDLEEAQCLLADCMANVNEK
jgi:hypothetical protein